MRIPLFCYGKNFQGNFLAKPLDLSSTGQIIRTQIETTDRDAYGWFTEAGDQTLGCILPKSIYGTGAANAGYLTYRVEPARMALMLVDVVRG